MKAAEAGHTDVCQGVLAVAGADINTRRVWQDSIMPVCQGWPADHRQVPPQLGGIDRQAG